MENPGTELFTTILAMFRTSLTGPVAVNASAMLCVPVAATLPQ